MNFARRPNRAPLFAAVAAAAALAFVPLRDAKANVITFDYTGLGFTNTAEPSLGTKLDATVTVDVANGYTGYVNAANIISYTMFGAGSNPLVTVTYPGNSTNYNESFAIADQAGQEVVTDWAFSAQNATGIRFSTAIGGDSIFDSVAEKQDYNFSGTGTWMQAASVTPPPAPVPEPASWAILGVPLLAVPFMRRRRAHAPVGMD